MRFKINSFLSSDTKNVYGGTDAAKQPVKQPRPENHTTESSGCGVQLHPESHSHGRYSWGMGPHSGQVSLPLG